MVVLNQYQDQMKDQKKTKIEWDQTIDQNGIRSNERSKWKRIKRKIKMEWDQMKGQKKDLK